LKLKIFLEKRGQLLAEVPLSNDSADKFFNQFSVGNIVRIPAGRKPILFRRRTLDAEAPYTRDVFEKCGVLAYGTPEDLFHLARAKSL
jgi:hypothetical protein